MNLNASAVKPFDRSANDTLGRASNAVKDFDVRFDSITAQPEVEPAGQKEPDIKTRFLLLELRVKGVYEDAQSTLEHAIQADDDDGYCGIVSDLCDDLFHFILRVDRLREGMEL